MPLDPEILQRLKENDSKLTELSFMASGLSLENIRDLAEALQQNMILAKFRLGYNYVGSVGTKYLANALEKNKALIEFALDFSRVDDVGARCLADMLLQNTTLKKLVLSNNIISCVGAQYLANALKQNVTLSELSLYGNELGCEGAKVLVDALQHNMTLTKLDLRYNKICDEGAQAFAKALEYNTTIIKLYFSQYDTISEVYFKKIKVLLARNRQLAAEREQANKANQSSSSQSAPKIVETEEVKPVPSVTQSTTTAATNSPPSVPTRKKKQQKEKEKQPEFPVIAIPIVPEPVITKLVEQSPLPVQSPMQQAFSDPEPSAPPQIPPPELNDGLTSVELQKVREVIAGWDNLPKNRVPTLQRAQAERLEKALAEHQKFQAEWQQRVNSHSSSVKQLSSQQERLLSRLTKEQANQLLVDEISECPNLKTFYNTFVISFEALILVIKTTSTSILAPKPSIEGHGLGAALKLTGKALSVPIISGIFEVMGQGAELLDIKQRQEIFKRFSSFGTLADFKQLGETVALLLTQRYQSQIKAVMTPTEQKIFEAKQSKLTQLVNHTLHDAKESLLHAHEAPYAAQMAEFAVWRMMAGICDDHIKSSEHLAKQLLHLVTAKFAVRDRMTNDVSSALGFSEVVNKAGEVWLLNTVYQKPGFRVTSEEKHTYYAKRSNDYPHYGFRESTIEEVEQLKLKALPVDVGRYELDTRLMLRVPHSEAVEDTSLPTSFKHMEQRLQQLSTTVEKLVKQSPPSSSSASRDTAIDTGDGQMQLLAQRKDSSSSHEQQAITTEHHQRLSQLEQVVAGHEEDIRAAMQQSAPKPAKPNPVFIAPQQLKVLALRETETYIQLAEQRHNSNSRFSFFNQALNTAKATLAIKLNGWLHDESRFTDLVELREIFAAILASSQFLCEEHKSNHDEFEQVLENLITKIGRSTVMQGNQMC